MDNKYLKIDNQSIEKKSIVENNNKNNPNLEIGQNNNNHNSPLNNNNKLYHEEKHSLNIQVTKRSGIKENIDLDKIHRVLQWAAEDLENVSVSQVELKSHIQFFNGITTKSIHELLIKATADLITENNPDYQYMAAKLTIFHIRKKAYKQFLPPKLYNQINKVTNLGYYDPELLSNYSEAEINTIDNMIDHNRDFHLTYAGIKQFEGKYLIKNRVSNQIYETPQFTYILIAMSFFMYEKNKDQRLQLIKDFYNAVSNFKISLPTPILAGLRSKTRQFSSCVLINCGDSLNSINATTNSIIKYVSQKAGIGINAGRIRSLGSPIRKGDAYHTGVIPFIKLFQSAVKSCSQGGVRGGAATVFFPLWHLEIESILVLKNNRGIEENRARHLDYGIQLNKLMYERFINNQDITLFCPNEVPDLYDAFFQGNDLFNKLYLKYEDASNIIQKKTIKARELFTLLTTERAGTGRVYIQNIDHCNEHSAFNPQKAPIQQSNLCMEVTLPTKPINDDNHTDKDGEIALCTLSAFNLGNIEDLTEIKDLARLIVRALDNIFDLQNYPIASAKKHAKARRSLGIGVTNFAYYLAKNNSAYTKESAISLTHNAFEAIQYYLLSASNELAKEKGKCEKFYDTTYSQGILPIDTYKKDIDEFCQEKYNFDWEELRQNILKYGLRNSTLSAQMPCETSSQVCDSTNGIEPPRAFVSIKISKDGVFKQVVPNIKKYKEKYELLWTIPNNNYYLKLVSIMQKFIDQTISANTNYIPNKYQDKKVPLTAICKDLILAYKWGVKTLYYHNTNDGSTENNNNTKNSQCESCVL